MPTNFSFTADTSSALGSTSTVTPGGATLGIGGAAPATNALLRFATTTAGPAAVDTIVSATLSVKVSAQAAVPINVDVYAAQFGAAIAIADVNVADSNKGIADGNTSGYRVKLKQILSSAAAIGTVASITIPARFINRNAALNGGFTDFELRPGTGFVPGATALTTIHGPAATTSTDKPTLAIVTVTDAELLIENTYRMQAVGEETFVAFAREATPGVPVKAKTMLDFRSSTLDSYAVNLRSQSLSKQRARPRKLAPGRSGAGGEVTFELTPEKWVQMLPGILKKTATAGSGPYTHTFKVAATDEIATYTFVQKNGDFREVYPGCMIDALSLTCNLDEVVLGSVSVQARDKWLYDEPSAGANDEYVLSSTAGYDTVDNAMLSFIGGAVTVDGVVDRGMVQSATVTFRQNVRERRGLNRKRSVASHYAGGFEVAVNFTMFFENEIQLRKFLGVRHKEFPFKPGKTIEFQAVQFDFEGVNGSALQNISILIPKMLYEAVRTPINGEGAIMLECSGVAAYDDSTNLSNVVVTVVNGEPPTAFDASTETVTVIPSE